jgi:hypothetical protein
MKIMCKDDLTNAFKNEHLVFYLLDPKDGEVFDIITSVDPSKYQDIVVLLNKINNQGIESVDLANYTYVREGKVIPLVRMATSELIFLVAACANYTSTKICLWRDMRQLRVKTFKLFLAEFKNSEYITLIFDKRSRVEITEEMLNA